MNMYWHACMHSWKVNFRNYAVHLGSLIPWKFPSIQKFDQEFSLQIKAFDVKSLASYHEKPERGSLVHKYWCIKLILSVNITPKLGIYNNYSANLQCVILMHHGLFIHHHVSVLGSYICMKTQNNDVDTGGGGFGGWSPPDFQALQYIQYTCMERNVEF